MLSKELTCRFAKVFVVFLLSGSTILSLYGGGSISTRRGSMGSSAENEVYISEEFAGYNAEFLQEVYKDAPQDVRYIVNFLKDPGCGSGEDDRFAVFYSEPGNGKTVQSLAVPYMAGWHCANRVPGQLLSATRNGTAHNLVDDISKALEPGEKVVYIMQDFNVLVDQQELPQRDNAATAEALFDTLDVHNKNQNFYFIGTASEVRYIGKALKEKFLPHIIEFCGPQTAEERVRLFKQHLSKDEHVRLAPDCTDEFLYRLFGGDSLSEQQRSTTDVWSGIERRAFRILAHRFARINDPIGDKVEVALEHRLEALERLQRSKKIFRYNE